MKRWGTHYFIPLTLGTIVSAHSMCRHIFDVFDKDRDGEISFEEVLRSYREEEWSGERKRRERDGERERRRQKTKTETWRERERERRRRRRRPGEREREREGECVDLPLPCSLLASLTSSKWRTLPPSDPVH